MAKETSITKTPQSADLEKVLVTGDLSSLSPEQRTSYYMKVCESVGLNPLTKPFEYITLNGKLQLYALRSATDQLRKVHNVSINITDRKNIDGVYVVTAKAKMGEREDESTGAVSIGALKGDALANGYLKAETKAKRRVTLSICGLGVLDETEVETIKDVTPPPEQKKKSPGILLVELAKSRKYSIEDLKEVVGAIANEETMARLSVDQINEIANWIKLHPPEDIKLLYTAEDTGPTVPSFNSDEQIPF